MSLRLQLTAFVALTFFLPWAGLRLVESQEATLRVGLENLLTRNADLVARSIAGSENLRTRLAPPDYLSQPLYLHPLSRPPRLDGTRGDWQFAREPGAPRALRLADGSRLWLGIHSSFLYLFVEVLDDDIVYQRAPGAQPFGDRVVLVYGTTAANSEALLLAREPGSVAASFRARPTAGGGQYAPAGDFEELVRGYWAELDQGGYAIEARMPLSMLRGGAGIGIGVIDSDDGGASVGLAATTWDDAGVPNALITERPELEQLLRPFAGGNQRFRVFDADGWVLADAGTLEPAVTAEAPADPTLVERLFRRILRRDDPEHATTLEAQSGRIGDPALLAALAGEPTTAWYRRGDDVSAIVAAAVPLDPSNPGRAAVLIEEASDPILTLSNQAMVNVVTTTVVVGLTLFLGLLAYASFLSFRIGRLARAAESALGPRGEIRPTLPGSRAADEIGDLSRSFQDLLKRLRDYTDYLQSLKSKLSHEIRTPLAIVATSADNLEHETSTEAGRNYLTRLRQGAERLEAILRAMTAATRVEQAIAHAEIERFDINEVVGPCVFAYRDVYDGQSFVLDLPDGPLLVDGSAELIAQMLDKLIDNAVSFAGSGTAIEVGVRRDGGEARLSVLNRGPLLPESMRHQIFDSLVSVREETGDKPHLGLGLHIVTLVAEFHGGRVEAENLEDGSGVRMTVVLPCRDAGAA